MIEKKKNANKMYLFKIYFETMYPSHSIFVKYIMNKTMAKSMFINKNVKNEYNYLLSMA